MAKAPKVGKCVHCLKDPVERNWDHVFPQSWFPDSTPKNLEKWKVPSCLNCNRELGAIESEFFVRIALCLNSNAHAFQGLSQRALRALKPELASNPGDKRAREALAKKLASEMLQGEQIPTTGTYPALGEKWGRPHGSGIAIQIPAESFRRITAKIVRGIVYVHGRKFIEPPHKIDFFALDDAGAQPIKVLLEQAGTTLELGPGLNVKRVMAPDGISAFYEIEFWQQFKAYASVLDDEEETSSTVISGH